MSDSGNDSGNDGWITPTSRVKRPKLGNPVEQRDKKDSSLFPPPDAPVCRFGVKCYRRNLTHLTVEARHPHLETILDFIKKNGNPADIPSHMLTSGMERRTVFEQVKIIKDWMEGSMKNEGNEPKPSTSSALRTPTGGGGASTNTNISETGSYSKELHELREQRKAKYMESKTKNNNIGSNSSSSRLSMQAKWEASSPFNFFLTRVTQIKEEKGGIRSAGFSDLFDPSFGDVKALIHFNFMVEPEWLIEQSIRAKVQDKPTRVVFDGSSKDLQGLTEAFPSIKVFGVKSPFPFGHHHTKMTIVQYTDLSLRFFVYTANLIESDWESRTQGIWISPRCPKMEDPSSGDSVTKFRTDIIQYLNTYPVQVTRAWIDVIKCVDCSQIKVYFVASAPVTAQSGTSGFQWASCKMDRILKSYEFHTDPSWSLVIQCSSIGTLGKGVDEWVKGELGAAFAGKDRVQQGPVHVIYPSHSNVKSSYEGLLGGGCLPYSASTHAKQPWLERHFCQWKADRSGRSQAVPHIKSYFRVSPDNTKISWFLLTSANLSKAAWGKINKNRDRLSVMSWEAGVLFLPPLLTSKDHFDIVPSSSTDFSSPIFPLHVDLPPTKYEKNDKPWFFEILQAHILQHSGGK